MIDYLLVPITIIYFFVIGLLFAYGINFFYMTWVAMMKKPSLSKPAPVENWPSVTVQLPIYNEMYVAKRLIEAAARLNYPKQLLEIQVLDDSEDATVYLVHRTVQRLRSQGIQIMHLRREHRRGYKAGALADGFKQAKGEYLTIFDADFVPRPDFLIRTLPYLIHTSKNGNENTAFIQTRWSHLNRNYSVLTLLQSLSIDAHFKVEQYARSISGFWFNFNGTAGIWRKQAIVDAGGWKADTLTEDLDISYRAFLKGWKAVYLDEVDVPAELPMSFTAYRRQQHRWARGSFECAIKLLPQVWDAQEPFAKKIAATLHLTGYGVHLLLFALSLLYPLILLVSRHYPMLISLFGITSIFNLTAFAPSILNIVSQHRLGRAWWRMLPAILFMSILGAGMMANTLRAAGHVLFNRSGVFERTPKFGISTRGQDWKQRKYQIGLDPLVFVELGLALVNFITVLLAISLGNYVIAAYATLFFTGLCFASGLTIKQTLSIYRNKNTQQSVQTRDRIRQLRGLSDEDKA
jgi:cellulose synthase/poly-beta-1,6-N-acetylglucosamine synthase-like glycosyltransferase